MSFKSFNLNRVIFKSHMIFWWEWKQGKGQKQKIISKVFFQNIIVVNGVGKLFTYNFDKKEFKTVKSNLNQIFESQDFKGKVIKNLFGNFKIKIYSLLRMVVGILTPYYHQRKYL